MKRLKERLAALEQRITNGQQRITRITLLDAETGEVGGVINVGGQPDHTDVLQVLEYKHKARPPRILTARNAISDQSAK